MYPYTLSANETSLDNCVEQPHTTSLPFYSISPKTNVLLRSARRQLRQQRLRSLAISRRRNLRRLSIALRHALIFLAHFLRHAARVADGRGITIVGVNAHKVRGHTVDLDVADHDISGASVASTVAAAAVNLSDAYKGRIFDRHGAAAVVLDDFIFGCVGSAALPEDVASAESGDCVCRGKVLLVRRFSDGSCYGGLPLTLTNIRRSSACRHPCNGFPQAGWRQ
jgi:hypothetical protein